MTIIENDGLNLIDFGQFLSEHPVKGGGNQSSDGIQALLKGAGQEVYRGRFVCSDLFTMWSNMLEGNGQ